ncbi:Dr1-associated corepressor [Liparis tanakae]|uniref:Dr1-associated corepressor n=1 Tax=Liparis tanakae TaxID=230148 RepID=A0A4Z2EZN7_9TELE|nr:Dr1-associated corepressor [Liparis tanakae]
MQGEGEENHTEGGGEKVPRRGRKPGSGRKNGGAGSKAKDKKLSGTESEQEDDSEDSETDEDDGFPSAAQLPHIPRLHRYVAARVSRTSSHHFMTSLSDEREKVE